MARTITSANISLFLSIEDLYDTPQQLQGFATDDVFDTDSVAPTEVMMGVDGRLSGGKVHVPVVQNISFQADSDSVILFEQWLQQMEAIGETLVASGSAFIPATGRKYTMKRGFLTGGVPTAIAKRTLQPRRFSITWERVSAANF